MSAQYFGRQFWIGPIVGCGDPGGAGRPITISGQAHPSQGKAQAAGLVPVTTTGDRLLPVDGTGRAATLRAVAKLSDVPSDGDGWFTLEAEPVWWDGAEGVLALLLYDINLGSGPSFGRLQAAPALAPKARRSSPANVYPAWSPDTEKAMHDALERYLQARTAAHLRQGLVKKPSLGPIRANPTRDADELTFVLASCQYPAGMLDRKLAEASYVRLARMTEDARFVLLVGDQVYLDPTAGLFDPTTQFDRFALPHNSLMRMLTRLNVFPLRLHTMLDDHEIQDNWEPLAYDSRPDPLMVTGREYYLKRQRLSGPAQVKPRGDSREPLWYTLPEGFFIADTRTERTPRTAETIKTARIMSETQFDAILSWLGGQPAGRPKFIACPSILLPRRLRTGRGEAAALRSDAWDGYPWSLNRLLACIVERQIEHVVFLSGDEHLSCIVKAQITAENGKSMEILSVHSSALYAPYPFANSIRADLAFNEKYDFTLPAETLCGTFAVGGRYGCAITRSEVYPGDGFAVLRTERTPGGWSLYYRFSRASNEDVGRFDF